MMMNKTRTLGVDKFDVVVMNPPYQELKPGFKKSQAIWDKFVIKVIEQSLVEGGYLVAVHPDNWRNIGKAYNNVKNILKNKQLINLELHNKYDGQKMFGASTTYDFYCLKNTDNKGNFITKIKCLDGKTERVNISKMEFIPNGMYTEFNKLLAKSGEEKVEILYSRSMYGNDKLHMNKIQSNEFLYPCVYLTYQDGSINFWYSSINKGHFSVPKVIWSNGISTPFVDIGGKYGVMNFSCSIVDKLENLQNIKKAMLNPKFIKLMTFSDGITGTGHRYNQKAISLFRKDFWVDFLDYNNDDE